jgi:hypothetical protein
MAPARRIAGPVAAGQNAAPAAGQAGNNNSQQQVGPANIEVGGGTLSPLTL